MAINYTEYCSPLSQETVLRVNKCANDTGNPFVCFIIKDGVKGNGIAKIYAVIELPISQCIEKMLPLILLTLHIQNVGRIVNTIEVGFIVRIYRINKTITPPYLIIIILLGYKENNLKTTFSIRSQHVILPLTSLP